MRISVLGWTGKHNVGDEAYKLAFPNLLPGHDLSFIDQAGMSDFTVPAPDAIILGGGDVVYPEFTREFRWRPAARRLAASVSLTKASDFEFLRTCEAVFVRDHASLRHAAANGVDASYLPDFAFTLTPDRAAGVAWVRDRFAAEGLELYQKLVVVVGSAYLMKNGLDDLARDHATFQYVSQELARAFDEAAASFLYLPFGTAAPHDDRACNAWIASRCKWRRKACVVYDRPDVRETLDAVAAADVVVSSRLHASIFSTVAGVPLLDVTHHDKGRGFAELVGGRSDAFSFWEFDARGFRECLHDRLRRGDGGRLAAFTSSAREQLRNATLL